MTLQILSTHSDIQALKKLELVNKLLKSFMEEPSEDRVDHIFTQGDLHLFYAQDDYTITYAITSFSKTGLNLSEYEICFSYIQTHDRLSKINPTVFILAFTGLDKDLKHKQKHIRHSNYETRWLLGSSLNHQISLVYDLVSQADTIRALQKMTREPFFEINLVYFESYFYWQIKFKNQTYTLFDGAHLDFPIQENIIEELALSGLSMRYVNINDSKRMSEYIGLLQASILATLVISPQQTLSRKQLLESCELLDYMGFNHSEVSHFLDLKHSDLLWYESESQIYLKGDLFDLDFKLQVLQVLIYPMIPRFLVESDLWTQLIDPDLLEVTLLHAKQELLSQSDRDNCLRLIQWSPSALSWALRNIEFKAAVEQDTKESQAQLIQDFKKGLLSCALQDQANGNLAIGYLNEQETLTLDSVNVSLLNTE